MDNQFQTVENEYFRLKGQFATGRLTREQFETALQALMFTDAQGRYWMIGADSGKWFLHDGVTWVEQDPQMPPSASPAPLRPSQLPERSAALSAAYRAPTPAAPNVTQAPLPTAPPAPGKKSGGCVRNLVFGCLGLIILCALLGGGIYFGLQSGAVTQDALLTLAGMGSAHVTVNNFRDEPVSVKIIQLDVKEDSFPSQTDMQLNAFDIRTFSASNAARYRATFALTSDGTSLGECVMQIRSGDQYQFIALPDGIMVNRENNPPTLGTDLVVATSTLCRAQ